MEVQAGEWSVGCFTLDMDVHGEVEVNTGKGAGSGFSVRLVRLMYVRSL